jgi:peptidoglycan/LPS O-acetylase OafA/YrhL
MSNVRHDKLVSLQAARGIAALVVVFYHYQQIIRKSGPDPLGGFFDFGGAGVYFFFVLSGFIIFYIHRNDIDCPARWPSYAWKRVTRIYPMLACVMLLLAAKSIYTGQFWWSGFIKTVLLIPQPHFPMLGPSWTLVHEMIFYAFFGLAILHRRLGYIGCALWACCTMLAAMIDWQPAPGFIADLVSVLTAKYNGLFIAGIAVAWIVMRRPIPCPRLIAAAGAVCFFGTATAHNAHALIGDGVAEIGLYGLSSAIMLAGLAGGELLGRIRVGKVGELLGDLSYPLYLIHMVVGDSIIEAIAAVGVQGPGWLILFASVGAACVIALLLNRLLERPIATALRQVWKLRLAGKYAALKPDITS